MCQILIEGCKNCVLQMVRIDGFFFCFLVFIFYFLLCPYIFVFNWASYTCQFFKSADMNFCQFLETNIIFMFNHKQYTTAICRIDIPILCETQLRFSFTYAGNYAALHR
jgi:hypothetical protein